MKICLKNQVGGRSKFNEKNFYNFFFFIFTKSHAAIIDYEIEKLIRDYLNLIQTVNNSNKQVNFLIILDENPNAFVNEKRELYITTGLLKYSPSYKALIGVLAHELGHLENFHISKRIDSIKKLRSINQLNSLSIIAASILSNNSDFLLQSMATNQLGIQNYYSAFSKDQEREADTYAAKTLKKLNISSKSLMDFLKFLENRSYKKGSDPDNFMFASHPIYEERFEILRNFSITDNNLLDKKNEERFNFIKAKLFGFTEKNNQKFDMYLKLYTHKHSYREIAKFSTWLYTIASNLAKTELRKLRRRRTYSASDLSRDNREFVFTTQDDQTFSGEDGASLGKNLQAALNALPQDFKTIIIFFIYFRNLFISIKNWVTKLSSNKTFS